MRTDRTPGAERPPARPDGDVANSQAAAQRAWDMAADLAAAGRDLRTVVSHVVDVASRDIDEEVDRQVPLRGRTFRFALARAIGWGVAIDLGLLAVGSSSIHPVPGLTLAICLGVLVWALVFGFIAGRNRVHVKRTAVRHAQREMYDRIASDACLRVWAAQVPGQWQPCGPQPGPDSPRQHQLPAAWLARWGDRDGRVRAVGWDGSVELIDRTRRDADPRPVALFAQAPVLVSAAAREAADRAGLAAFRLDRSGIEPLTAPARKVLTAYRAVATARPPAQLIEQAWSRGVAG